jgi:hypothetical protein
VKKIDCGLQNILFNPKEPPSSRDGYGLAVGAIMIARHGQYCMEVGVGLSPTLNPLFHPMDSGK